MSQVANTPVSTSAFPNMRNVAHPDNEQRRHDYETACVAEREYYKRKESDSLTHKPVGFKKMRKASKLSGPSHQRYLRQNKWIKATPLCWKENVK